MDKYRQWLRNHNLKATDARMHLLEVLDSTDKLLTAEDLYFQLKKALPELSLSTVYRSLEQLSQNHLVSEVNVENRKETHFELSHTTHAHHLMCLSCGKLVHLEDCPVRDYVEKTGRRHGFNITDHRVDLYGYCSACQEQ